MTIIYNVAGTADSTATLSTTQNRYGIELNGATSALVGKQIGAFTIPIRKTFTPSADINVVVRRASDDAAVATSVETVNGTVITASYLPYTFTFSPPYTLQNLDKIMVEYNGAGNIIIPVYTTDQFDGLLTRRIRFTPPSTYAAGNTNDIVATISDGIYPSNTDTHIYKIRTVAANQDTHLYKIRTVVSNLDTHIYKILSTVIPAPPSTGGGITTKKRNRYRNYINRLAFDLRNLFKIKQRKPEDEPEEVEIPPAQPPKTTTILPGPPDANTKLETINDMWSIVASIPAPEPRTEIIYPPVILNPSTSPLIQKTVSFPSSTVIKQTVVPRYKVAQGSHIDSQVIGLSRPKNRSKTASTLNSLMLLLDMESRI